MSYELRPVFDTFLSALQKAYLKIRIFQFKPLKNALRLKATSIVLNGEKHNIFRLKFQFSLILSELSFL
jgi:hypothetical protein